MSKLGQSSSTPSMSLKLFVEIASLSSAAFLAISALANSGRFWLIGIDYFAIATPTDIIMGGASLLVKFFISITPGLILYAGMRRPLSSIRQALVSKLSFLLGMTYMTCFSYLVVSRATPDVIFFGNEIYKSVSNGNIYIVMGSILTLAIYQCLLVLTIINVLKFDNNDPRRLSSSDLRVHIFIILITLLPFSLSFNSGRAMIAEGYQHVCRGEVSGPPEIYWVGSESVLLKCNSDEAYYTIKDRSVVDIRFAN